MSDFPEKHDDWKWHRSGEFPRGRPRLQGYVHIAVYLAWVIRRDLHDPEFFASGGPHLARAVAGIRAGRTLGMSIREDLDGALADEQLNATGRAFTAAYYGLDRVRPFFEDWVTEFGEAADTYAVPPTEGTFSRMEPILDARFAAWQNGSSPPWPKLHGPKEGR